MGKPLHLTTSKIDNEDFWKKIEIKQADWLNKFNRDFYQNQNFQKSSKDNFFILMPPPNITGVLHFGHIWNIVIQDFLVKWEKIIHRKNVLWMPGFDHAGIATQIVIWRLIDQLNLPINKLNRQEINDYFWNGFKNQRSYKDKTTSYIKEQLQKFFLSLDYDKTYFTLNSDVSALVKDSFIKYFKANIIYQAKKIVHWDTVLETAISDLEVKHQKIVSKLYYFKYFSKDEPNFYLEIATTRPETIFADSALIVNPDDKRYRKFLNKLFVNPLTLEPIPLLTDKSVDIHFGTGVMKCTPAHDFKDFEIGKKYNLKNIICLTTKGRLNSICNEFKGLTIQEARKEIVKKYLHKSLSKVEDYENIVSLSSRSNTITEPYLSKQYFLKMSKLVKIALKFQNNEKTKVNFYPQKFEKIFFNWLHNCQDWCISRQLFIGHQIPLFYDHNNNLYLQKNEINKPINDVLDTWYSSSILPLLFLKHQPKLLKSSSLTSVLVTGYDILFFWVIRMILQTVFLKGSLPFKNVYLHGLVRDKNNKKMSKSNNNGIDPMLALKKFSSDTLRLFFLEHSSLGHDLKYNEEQIILNRRFFSKIVNLFKWWTQVKKKFKNHFNEMELFWKNEFLNNFDYQFFNFYEKLSFFYNKYQINLLVQELKSFIQDKFSNTIVLEIKNNFNLFEVNDLEKYFKIILVILFPFLPLLSSYLLEQAFKVEPQNFLNQDFIKEFFSKKPQESILNKKEVADFISVVEKGIKDNNVESLYLFNLFSSRAFNHKIKNFLLQKSQKLKIISEEYNKQNYPYLCEYFRNDTFTIYCSLNKFNQEKSKLHLKKCLENETRKLQNHLKNEINKLKINIKQKKELLSNQKILAKADKKFIMMIMHDLDNKQEKLKNLLKDLKALK